MTSVVFHRTAFSGCRKAPAARSSRAPGAASVPKRLTHRVLRAAAEEPIVLPENVSAEAISEADDVLTTPEVNSAADIEKQLAAVTDDAILLTEEEAELYQDFEKEAKEVIGSIKDDYQLEVGFTEEELVGDALAASASAAAQFGQEQEAEDAGAAGTEILDLSAEELMVDDDLELEDEDEEELDGEVNVEKVLDFVERIQEKYEMDEEIQDALQAAAAATKETEAVVVPEVDESDLFFTDAMPGLEEDVPEYPPPEFKLSFLWMEKNMGLAVDQIYAKGGRSPLTEFFMWPRKDAWEDLRIALEARPWMNERDKIVLLNRATEVINFWQDEDKKTIEAAREAFPDCDFMSDN